MRFKGIPRHARVILGAPRTTRGLALPTRAAIAGVPRKPQLDGLPVLRDRNLVVQIVGYPRLIQNSLRLRAAANATMESQFGAGGNNLLWTLNFNVKRGLVDAANRTIIGWGTSGDYGGIRFNSSYQLEVFRYNGSFQYQLITNSLYRDPLAHMNVNLRADTANGTAANRLILEVNGVQVTSFATASYPSASSDSRMLVNTGYLTIGATANTGGAVYFDGLVSEIRLIDGQALPASAFIQPDGVYAQYWMPKLYAGSHGTQGRFYEFKDASAATAGAIGKDTSGNGLNITPANISVTAGPTFDQLTDTPTNNYATLDPNNRTDSSASLANANLSYTGGNNRHAASTIRMDGGKWYFEGGMSLAPTSGQLCFGVSFRAYAVGAAIEPGFSSDTHALYIPSSAGNRGYWTNSAQVFNVGAALDETRTYKAAIDIDAGKAWFGYDTVWFNSSGAATGDPASGANPTFTFTPGTPAWAVLQASTSNTGHVNFGQRPFAQAAPSGFNALRTQSMSATTIALAGSFTGNAAADGPPIWTGGSLATLTINGNAVTWGTHADRTAGGFKLRSSSASYNAAGTNNWTATVGVRFVSAEKFANNAQVNP